MRRGIFARSIRPPNDGVTPNPNDPADVPPATVGPPSAVPGDPNGIVIEGEPRPAMPLPRIVPSAWSGWPANWWPPLWNGSSNLGRLPDIAWLCMDLNSSILATMPPYLVGAAPSTDASWLWNPDPDVYTSWDEFANALFWDYQLGEAFVIATARYATGWPARFHVVPPWAVNVDFVGGRRVYDIGGEDVTADILHIRYRSSVDDARGHGPLEAGSYRMVAVEMLNRYAFNLSAGGGIPAGLLNYPPSLGELTAEQAAALKAEWIAARASGMGEPAVLSGGITFETTQVNPEEMALVDLTQLNEARVANLLGVPGYLVGLPTGDSMTYANVSSVFDYHWRRGLRPKAQFVTAALSEWALPRGTVVEVNRDAYVQPGPLERAQTDQILSGITDSNGNPAKTVEEIRAQERFDDAAPSLQTGVLRG